MTACILAAETGTMTPRRRQRRKRQHSAPHSARRELTWRNCWLRRNRSTEAITTGKHGRCRRARLPMFQACMPPRASKRSNGSGPLAPVVAGLGRVMQYRLQCREKLGGPMGSHCGSRVPEACPHGGSLAPHCCRARVNLAQDVGLPPENGEGAYQVRTARGCVGCARECSIAVDNAAAHGGPGARVLCQPLALGSLPTPASPLLCRACPLTCGAWPPAWSWCPRTSCWILRPSARRGMGTAGGPATMRSCQTCRQRMTQMERRLSSLLQQQRRRRQEQGQQAGRQRRRQRRRQQQCRLLQQGRCL